MIQVIEQTDEEQMAMYMELSKEKLVEMLIECNKELSRRVNEFNSPVTAVPSYPDQHIHNFVQYDEHWKRCTHCNMLQPISFSPYNI